MAEAKRIRQEIAGVVSVLGAIYIGLCLATYSKWDSSLFVSTTLPTRNYGGIVGSYLADFMISSVGFIAFVGPVALLVFGIKKLLGKEGHKIYAVGLVMFILSAAMMVSLMAATLRFSFLDRSGGVIGLMLSDYAIRVLSIPGAYILTLAFFLSSVIILSPVSLTSLVTPNPERQLEEEPAPEPETGDEGPVILGGPPEETNLLEPETPTPELTLSMPEREPLRRRRLVEEKPSVEERPMDGVFELPRIEFLNPPSTESSRPARDEVLQSSSLLEKTLRDFDVEGKVTLVQSGPVVTMYEFEPAPGVKINRVVGLADDLALALKAQSVRVSTLPHKAAIGIEVPNSNREIVCLREIISSENFQKSHSKLTLALGKDIFGNPIVTDLMKMPHLLVAGATGSGKSVSINSMVMSLLYKATPREVKMLMIDPKLLELSHYENIPHLISPVITGAKDAAEALRKMVFEMERRYRLLADKGVRNIETFNRMVPDEQQLPFIVIFIDELADLMFASANEVEDSIARLAQMARASGIHLILATQRPSVDVITGVIKANFPARISFQVTSRIDSRTIIDGQGAEQLLGRGDMLLMLPGVRMTRIHGALVTEDEIHAVTSFVTSQGAPDYTLFESITVEEPEKEGASDERDDLYHKVLEFAEYSGEVSISSIQRRFKIGYNRAARVMELFEEDGLVGPPKGAGKPRDFLGRRK